MKNVEIIVDVSCHIFEKRDKIVSNGLVLLVNNRYGPDPMITFFDNKSIFSTSIFIDIVRRYRTHRYCKSYKVVLNENVRMGDNE